MQATNFKEATTLVIYVASECTSRDFDGRESYLDVQGSLTLLYAFVLVTNLQFDLAVSYLYEHGNEHCVPYAIHPVLFLYRGRRRGIEGNATECMLGHFCEELVLCSLTDAKLYALSLQTKMGVQSHFGHLA